VRIDNSSGAFYSGMVVKATAAAIAGDPVIRIPITAVRQPYGQNPQVLLVVGDGTVSERDVQLGPTHGDLVDVAAGLADGDRVIVRGQHRVVTGDKVNAQRASPAHPSQVGARVE
jgi:multidrug efflux pump subunit AcrA (membrane-fusion protein)